MLPYKYKLKMSSFINSSLLEEDIELYYLEKKLYPHCLIQLSDKEYKDLKENSIHVTKINNSNKRRVPSDACVQPVAGPKL